MYKYVNCLPFIFKALITTDLINIFKIKVQEPDESVNQYKKKKRV